MAAAGRDQGAGEDLPQPPQAYLADETDANPERRIATLQAERALGRAREIVQLPDELTAQLMNEGSGVHDVLQHFARSLKALCRAASSASSGACMPC